ncbi:MAG: SPOR domain-containing protein [Thermodesulfobacteriota bacterium]|nr:SPOR domain-containing protein [Thermodesulfobacteriota bacterium]
MAENKKKPAAREKRFFLAFSLPEAAGWSGVLVLVCAWFFVLGILVGRGLVPVPETETESVSAHLQRKRAESMEARANTASGEKLALEFHEALKTENPGDRHAIPSSAAVESDTPAVKQPQTRKPPDTPAVSDGTAKEEKKQIFTIQVAAVRDQTDAAALVKKLKKKGFNAYSTTVELSGGNLWYRIRCGAYEDRKTANPILNRLEDEGFGPMLVRR